MSGVDRVGLQPLARLGARTAGSSGAAGFTPPAEQLVDAARSPATAAPVALESLLALQQVDGAPARDREAYRRGQALLAALGRLQRRLLADGGTQVALQDIQALADDVPAAADPVLAAAVDQVVLRARIELARAGVTGG